MQLLIFRSNESVWYNPKLVFLLVKSCVVFPQLSAENSAACMGKIFYFTLTMGCFTQHYSTTLSKPNIVQHSFMLIFHHLLDKIYSSIWSACLSTSITFRGASREESLGQDYQEVKESSFITFNTNSVWQASQKETVGKEQSVLSASLYQFTDSCDQNCSRFNQLQNAYTITNFKQHHPFLQIPK